MKINIKATGIELTPAISDYVYKKLASLEKYIGNSQDIVAQVEVAKVTRHHKQGEIFRAEIHLTGGIDIYVATETEDLYSSIDKVKDDITLELVQTKDKQMTLTRKGAKIMKNAMRGFRDLGRFRFKRFRDKK